MSPAAFPLSFTLGFDMHITTSFVAAESGQRLDEPFANGPVPERGDLTSTYVTFDMGAQSLATDVGVVREILDMQEVAPLPNAGSELLGMIDVRGEGLAVLDLQSKLGLRCNDDSPDRRIIVLEIGEGTKKSIGIIADRVRNVTEIAADQIEPAPAVPGSWDSSVLEGVARIDGRLVYILSFTKLLAADMRGPFDFD
jgi:purine-binding chemotaxis protein CheW